MNAPTPQVTIAALAIFNGLKLAPFHVSPDPDLTLVGVTVAPKFVQCRNYMARFFTEESGPEAFNPLEIFDGALAASQWVRGGVGIMQYALFTESDMDIPDAASIDPAAWFEGLEHMADLWRGAGQEVDPEMLAKVTEAWQERDAAPGPNGSRAGYLARLYGQARELQAGDALLVGIKPIAAARLNHPPAEGQTVPFPHK
jgi:hypothetical protein